MDNKSLVSMKITNFGITIGTGFSNKRGIKRNREIVVDFSMKDVYLSLGMYS